MHREKPPYLPHVDGLRGIAVLAVILYHLNAGLLPGGFVGVDVFFVISGFVVSRSTGALRAPGFGRLLAHFYAHRVARIVPALVTCLVAAFLASCLFIPQSWLSNANEKTGLQAFFGLSNMVLAHTENDYFAPKAGFNPFTHTWSLGVEEQFYLVFPCLFMAWLWGKRRFSLVLFGAALLASLACALFLAHAHESEAFYFLLSRFWELALGVILLQLLPDTAEVTARTHPRGVAIGALLCLAGLGIAMIDTAPSSTPFPGSLLPCAATAGLIACLRGAGDEVAAARLLGWAPLRFVGRISYSLYLWHWPVFVLFRWTVGLDTVLACGASLVLVFMAAVASYRFIERPFRARFARTQLPNSLVVACGIAALLGGAGVSTALLSLRPVISLSTVTRHRGDWYLDMPRVDAAFPGCTADMTDLHLRSTPAWSSQRKGCDLPASFPKTLFVLGDSHAAAYTLMLRRFVRQTGARLFLYSSGGCSFLGVRPDGSGGCDTFETAAIGDISRRVQPGDVIFLPSLRIPRLVEEYVYFGTQSAMVQMFSSVAARTRQANVARAYPTLAAWASKGARIVFEAPTPIFNAPAFRCADWFDAGNPICRGGPSIERATILTLRQPIMQAFHDFTMHIPNVQVWDPLAVLCPGEMCQSYRDGRPLFFDGDHLSGYSNRLLLPSFVAALEKQ